MRKSRVGIVSRVLALLTALSLISGAASAAAPSEEEVSRIFRARKTSGAMVLAAKDGRIVYSACYGYADKRAKEEVTEDTYFKLASVSKLVTAVAVMRLVEAGQLDLDENLGHILGHPAYEAASPYFPEISLTCRHLMTHTAGIRDNGGGFTKKRKLSLILNPAENKKYSGFSKLVPGTAYLYSNFGAGILGCVLEEITGKRLTEAARALLFDPLGMDAAYEPTLLAAPEKIVTTYRVSGGADITRAFRLRQPYTAEPNPEKDYYDSYGGLWMKGEDLCRIGMLLCDGGVLEGTRYLKEETVAEMRASQLGRGGIRVDSPYGLNVERVTNLLAGRMVYGHQGLSNGVLCSLYFEPESRFVFALLTNGCNVNAKQDHICLLSRDLFALLWSCFAEEASGTGV